MNLIYGIQKENPLSSGIFPLMSLDGSSHSKGGTFPGKPELKERLGLWGRGPASWQRSLSPLFLRVGALLTQEGKKRCKQLNSYWVGPLN